MKLFIVSFLGLFILLSGYYKSYSQYDEKYRPQYHLSSKSSSMADPKGLFIFNGTYHLFWYGQWEHAVTNDLIHWQEWPKPMKDAPAQFSYFTGSVVVDTGNTSGFGRNAMIAFYTRHYPGDSLPETQCISISLDSGHTFHYYNANPVIDINEKYFRDPQVFWFAAEKKWKMVVALPDRHLIQIYESTNLKAWKLCSSFGNLGAKNSFWECPDLFPLTSPEGQVKWIMMIGRGPNRVQYFIGDFNGQSFTPDSRMKEYLDNGVGLDGEVFEDFESLPLNKWTTRGDAFSVQKNAVVGSDYLGKSYIGDLSSGSKTGYLKSQPFVIKKNTINFLLAGSQKQDSLIVKLMEGDKVLRSFTPFGNNAFKWAGWDVRDLKGKKVNIEIIDVDSSSTGKIGIDHILFSDKLINSQAEQALWLDYGDDFYATKTWRNYDTGKAMKDSVILISWLGNWQYARIAPTTWGAGFQSVPRSLSLQRYPEGLRIIQQPLNVLKSLRGDSIHLANLSIEGTKKLSELNFSRNTYELDAVFDASSTYPFGFNLLVGEGRSLKLTYDPVVHSFCIDRTNCTDFTSNVDFNRRFATKMYAPVSPESGKLRLHIYVDLASVEVFTNQGKVVLSLATYPSPSQKGIEVFSSGGNTNLLSLSAWPLSSIWE